MRAPRGRSTEPLVIEAAAGWGRRGPAARLGGGKMIAVRARTGHRPGHLSVLRQAPRICGGRLCPGRPATGWFSAIPGGTGCHPGHSSPVLPAAGELAAEGPGGELGRFRCPGGRRRGTAAGGRASGCIAGFALPLLTERLLEFRKVAGWGEFGPSAERCTRPRALLHSKQKATLHGTSRDVLLPRRCARWADAEREHGQREGPDETVLSDGHCVIPIDVTPSERA